MPENIAFVGVGRMGANMARRLKDCGHTITAVHDVHAAGAAALAAELGARHAATLAEVTAASELVFTVVTDDAAQLAVFTAAGGDAWWRRHAPGPGRVACASWRAMRSSGMKPPSTRTARAVFAKRFASCSSCNGFDTNSPGGLDFEPGGIQNFTADYAEGADELGPA